MNNTVKSEKYRKLSIASLITGILSYICILIIWLIFEILLRGVNFNEIIITILTFAVFGLAIAAIESSIHSSWLGPRTIFRSASTWQSIVREQARYATPAMTGSAHVGAQE